MLDLKRAQLQRSGSLINSTLKFISKILLARKGKCCNLIG